MRCSSGRFQSRFDAMGIPLAAGRNFTRRDDENAPRVAIVNRHFADHYWPNQDPLGKRFRLESAKNAWVEIVGIAKMSKYLFVAEPPSDFVYLPYRQNPSRGMFLVAQSSGDPAALAAPLREVVRGLDVNMPIFNVRTMDELYQMRATSVGAGRLLSAVFSTGDDRRDFVSLALVAPVVFVVTLLATYVPARHAALRESGRGAPLRVADWRVMPSADADGCRQH